MLPLRTVPPLRWEGCHCEAVAQMAVPAWPHLRIIWTQIVYLVFLKCYQCFLCAFVSPLQKENSPPPPANPPPKNDTSLRAIHRFPHDHQQNGVQINPQDTFHPHPRAFLQAVPVQKCAELQHKEVIQTSSAEGSAEMLGLVGLLTLHPFERKTSLPAILHLFLSVVANTEDKAAIY